MAQGNITSGRDFYSAQEEAIRRMRETANKCARIPPGYNGSFRQKEPECRHEPECIREPECRKEHECNNKHEKPYISNLFNLSRFNFLSSVKEDDFLLLALLFIILNENNEDDYLILLVLLILLFT